MKLSTLVMIGSEFQGILMKKEEEKQELLLKEKQQEKIRIRIDEKKQEKWEEIAFYILELGKYHSIIDTGIVVDSMYGKTLGFRVDSAHEKALKMVYLKHYDVDLNKMKEAKEDSFLSWVKTDSKIEDLEYKKYIYKIIENWDNVKQTINANLINSLDVAIAELQKKTEVNEKEQEVQFKKLKIF